MFNKDKSVRDAFTFSLGGINTVASFTAAPVIAHDRLRQAPPNRVRRSGEQERRSWIPRRFRLA